MMANLDQRTAVHLKLLSTEMKKARLEEEMRAQNEAYNAAVARLNELKLEKQRLKQESLQLLDIAKRHRPTEEEKEKFTEVHQFSSKNPKF